MIWLAYMAAWISSAVAVLGGLYYTHSPWCLLIMILPATLKITTNDSDDNTNEIDSDNY